MEPPFLMLYIISKQEIISRRLFLQHLDRKHLYCIVLYCIILASLIQIYSVMYCSYANTDKYLLILNVVFQLYINNSTIYVANITKIMLTQKHINYYSTDYETLYITIGQFLMHNMQKVLMALNLSEGFKVSERESLNRKLLMS